MTDKEKELREQFRRETDDMVFKHMEMSEQLKGKIRQAAAAESNGHKRTVKKSWKAGAAGLAAAIMIVVAIPFIGQQSTPTPADPSPPVQSNNGAAGSDLSQLTTTVLGSAEEAKTAFGDDLQLPTAIPDGYTLSEITAVGITGQPARDILLTYSNGEQTVTYMASRMAASYPADLFTETKVGQADGFIFEQSAMTELFWTVGDVHYGITGPVTGAEAKKLAESAAL